MKTNKAIEYVNTFATSEPQKVRFNEDTEMFTMNISQLARFKMEVATLAEGTSSLKVNSDESMYKFNYEGDEVQIELDPQYHTTSDKDTKVWTEKVGDISFKLIYHRTKEGKKEYRLFMAQKVNGKLKRTRIINDDIKRIHNNEKKFTEYFKDNILPKYKEEVKAG